MVVLADKLKCLVKPVDPPPEPAEVDTGAAVRNEFLDAAIKAGATVIGAVASLTFVAFVGAAILWARFMSAKLPADQAVAAVPPGQLVAVGASALVPYLLLAGAATMLVYLLDSHGRPYAATRRGLVALAGVEVGVAILVGDFHTKQTLALLAAIPVAAVLAHFVLDRIDDWTRGREGRDRSPRVICREGAKAVFEPRQGERSSGVRIARIVSALLALLGTVAAAVLLGGALRVGAIVAGVLIAVVAYPVEPKPDDGSTSAEHGPDGERTKAFSEILQIRFLIAVTLLVDGAIMLTREELWLAEITGVAVALFALLLLVAAATKFKFLLYGVAVFASVVVFGSALAYLRAVQEPEVQPVAALRSDGPGAICGIYVAETDDRLYLGRVDLAERSDDRHVRTATGRIFWVPRDKLSGRRSGRCRRSAPPRSKQSSCARSCSTSVPRSTARPTRGRRRSSPSRACGSTPPTPARTIFARRRRVHARSSSPLRASSPRRTSRCSSSIAATGSGRSPC